MSAQDNLSPRQFPAISAEDVLKLATIDSRHGKTVGDAIKTRSNMTRATELTEDGRLRSYDLKADMAENGMKEPLLIQQYKGQRTLMQGHHRVASGLALGYESFPYTNRRRNK